jgi:acetyl/propionyl-CoA carboxylase alpha subunit
MGEAAVAAARARTLRQCRHDRVSRRGPDSARFYFLEMNTRLQVEHPVTEAVTGVDLVRAQFAVASGEELPWTQSDLTQRGHAIECPRVCGGPDERIPSPGGPTSPLSRADAPGVRIDSGVVEGGSVPVNYDPLLAKVTALAESRPAAIARMVAALRGFPILGIRTNLPFLIRVLEHPDFGAGRLHTGFIDEHAEAFSRRARHRRRPLRLRGFGGAAPSVRLLRTFQTRRQRRLTPGRP